MVWKAAKPNVTEKQSKILCEIIDSRTSRHDHIQRAQIIQKSSEGLSDRKIAKLLDIGRITVATWRNRWLFNESTLLLIDEKEFGISYKNHIFNFNTIKDNHKSLCFCTIHYCFSHNFRIAPATPPTNINVNKGKGKGRKASSPAQSTFLE